MKYQMWSIRFHVYSSVPAIIVQRYALVFFFFPFFVLSATRTQWTQWRWDSYSESHSLGVLGCKQKCPKHSGPARCRVTAHAWRPCWAPRQQGRAGRATERCLLEKSLLQLLGLGANLPEIVSAMCWCSCYISRPCKIWFCEPSPCKERVVAWSRGFLKCGGTGFNLSSWAFESKLSVLWDKET